MGETTTLTVRVDPAIKKRLEAVARSERRSASFIAVEAIERLVSLRERQIAHIEDGLADLRRGAVARHEDVEAWLKSWGAEDELPPPRR